MSKKLQLLQIGENIVPLVIRYEIRSSLRVSFGREVINVRIPKQMGLSIVEEQYKLAKDWITKTFEGKPTLYRQYAIKQYNKKSIAVMGDHYNLYVTKEARITGSITTKNGDCRIKIPKDMSIFDESQMIRKLLSRGLSSLYIDQIRKEVHDVNNLHFGKPINQVRLKYNKSNWGSCSSKGNINLSSGLLLVPGHIRQYVIVHELAHLIEMNHSAKYWKVVEQVYPSYKLAENWLKDNSSLVDF